MSERGSRQRLRKAIRELDPVSIENRCGIGTPDLNYVEGWIECKWMRSWPQKPETIVRLPHDFQPEQRAWAKRRRRAGGKCWFMLQVGREWLLFDSLLAAEVIGIMTRAELTAAATRHWKNGLVDSELVEFLRNA